jgi:predicted ester cyclase
MLELMKKHLAQLSDQKWDDYKAGLDPAASYEEVATRQRAEGVEEYVKAVQRWWRAFSDLKVTLINGFDSGDMVVAEVEWEGTHNGPLETPFGTIQATNKRGRSRAVIIARIKNDKIVETRHYFDLLTVLEQMGAVPMIGAGAQPAAQPAGAPSRRH